jgi:hypothetical protein
MEPHTGYPSSNGDPVLSEAEESNCRIANQSGSWQGKRLRPRRTPDPGPPGAGSRCTDIHANTAGLLASAAMGLSGRLEFDSSNHGLC